MLLSPDFSSSMKNLCQGGGGQQIERCRRQGCSVFEEHFQRLETNSEFDDYQMEQDLVNPKTKQRDKHQTEQDRQHPELVTLETSDPGTTTLRVKQKVVSHDAGLRPKTVLGRKHQQMQRAAAVRGPFPRCQKRSLAPSAWLP